MCIIDTHIHARSFIISVDTDISVSIISDKQRTILSNILFRWEYVFIVIFNKEDCSSVLFPYRLREIMCTFKMSGEHIFHIPKSSVLNCRKNFLNISSSVTHIIFSLNAPTFTLDPHLHVQFVFWMLTHRIVLSRSSSLQILGFFKTCSP